MSQPNFLAADKKLVIDTIEGIHPNEEEHSTVIDVEPVSILLHDC